MSRNNDHTREHLSDYLYHQNYYKRIGIDLLRQTNTSISKRSNFTRKLEEKDSGKMFFMAEKRQKTVLIFFRFISCKYQVLLA